MKCANCGEENKEGSLFCKNCGSKLEVVVEPEVTAESVDTDNAPETAITVDSEDYSDMGDENLQNNDAACDGADVYEESNTEIEVNFGKLQGNVSILATQIDRIFEAYKQQYALLKAESDKNNNAAVEIIEGLKKELSETTDEKNAEIEKLQSEIQSLKDELANKDIETSEVQDSQELAALKEELETLTESNNSFKERQDALAIEIENLKAELDEKNNEIERLQLESTMPPIQKKCGKCGRIFEDDSAFCPFCGVTLV